MGTTYEFTVEARNSVGYSTSSVSVAFLHALPPEAPSAPTTTNSETNVIIDWTEPLNNGSPITSYTIIIEQNDGIFTADTTDCDGSDSTIFAAK